MTNQEIYELMAHFGRSGLQGLKLSQGDFSIELQKAVSAPAAVPAAPAVPAPPAAPEAARKEGPAITAPLVGTFYAAPAPEQPPFVAPGDRVEKGQTVCLLEAMKTMIEVPAQVPSSYSMVGASCSRITSRFFLAVSTVTVSVWDWRSATRLSCFTMSA